jgi:hypothetical protein
MNGQVALFNGNVRPDSVEYLSLAEDAVTVLDKKAQHVESSGAQSQFDPASGQLALFRRQDEVAEAEGRH